MLQLFNTATHDVRLFAQFTLAVIALAGVLLAALASFLSARKSVYVGSITVERSKWIEKLRSNLAAYSAELLRCSIQSSFDTKPSDRSFFKKAAPSNDKEFLDRFHRIEELAANIRLQLNPHGRIDGAIIFLLEHCGVYFVRRPKDINRFNTLLVKHSQWLLKSEWDRVKWEAGGVLYRLWNWRKASRLRRDYNRFLAGDGDITALLSLAIANKVQMEQGLNWITEEQYEELVGKLRAKPIKRSWLYRKMIEASTSKVQKRLKDAFAESSMAAEMASESKVAKVGVGSPSN